MTAGLLTLGASAGAWASDVQTFGVVKGVGFVQTNAAAAVADGGTNIIFWAFVSSDQGASSATNVSLRLPDGSTVVSIDSSNGDPQLQESFSSFAALDASYTNGLYKLIFETQNDGWHTNSLTLTGNVFLPIPHFSNYSAAQSVDPTNDSLLTWDALAGATALDFVNIKMQDCNGQNVIETGSPTDSTALNGLATSILIPAKTLRPGQVYDVQMMSGRFTTHDTNSYPGAVGLAGYLKVVRMTLTASGADYPTTAGTLTFGPGVVSQTIHVPILNDALDETNETFLVTLSHPTGSASLATPHNAAVVIADDDVGGLINLGATLYVVRETGQVANVTVKRSGGKAGSVTVDYTTVDGTATAGNDYSFTAGTLAFGSNELTKTIQIPILDDVDAEGLETFRFVLSHPTGQARLGPKTNAVITILDDELSLQFATNSVSVSEATGRVVLTVIRGGAATNTLTVDFATSDGTATAGFDYADTHGTLTFLPGALKKTILIPILNDTLSESAEDFTVTLSNVMGGGQLGPRQVVTVTILDNDVALRPRASRR